MAELTTLPNANPGKYTFGSSGNGTTFHLGGKIYNLNAGLETVQIPYRGWGAGHWSMSTILTARRQLPWPVEAGSDLNWLLC